MTGRDNRDGNPGHDREHLRGLYDLRLDSGRGEEKISDETAFLVLFDFWYQKSHCGQTIDILLLHDGSGSELTVAA